jgi:hypothetical protein
MGLHPSGAVSSVSCAVEDCHFTLVAGLADAPTYARIFQDEHAAQYEPGRAPDIAVDWEIVADCSVCEDGGDIEQEDDGVTCRKCDTRWSIDGRYGERDA